jgi:hypothetical protein
MSDSGHRQVSHCRPAAWIQAAGRPYPKQSPPQRIRSAATIKAQADSRNKLFDRFPASGLPIRRYVGWEAAVCRDSPLQDWHSGHFDAILCCRWRASPAIRLPDLLPSAIRAFDPNLRTQCIGLLKMDEMFNWISLIFFRLWGAVILRIPDF